MSSVEYNTTRDKLMIREYGRNVQKLVNYAISIEDKNERTQFCHFIIQVMGQMQTQKDGGDNRRKLWDHLYIISDFKLDIDAPFEAPEKDSYNKKPQPLEYRNRDLRYKQYGKNIELIIQKAIELEEGPEKDALTKIVANHLKKLYLNWNRDSVNDELIHEHLRILSKGKLKLGEGVTLNSTSDILSRLKHRKVTHSQNTQKNSHASSRYSNSNKKKGRPSNRTRVNK